MKERQESNNAVQIIEYEDSYAEPVKDLLVELQRYLAELDSRGVLVLKDEYRDGYFAFVREDVRKHDGKIFLAVKGGKAIGVIICKIFQGGGEAELTTSCPKVGFISDLSVTKVERGKGVGTALLERAEAYFKASGCVHSQLEVFAPNASAHKLYSKRGYEVNCLYLSKKVE